VEKIREAIADLRKILNKENISKWKRRVAFGDLFTDRWDNAREMGWAEGASCYDSVLVLGDVKVGKHTWIGPNVVLDGSAPGGLVIGDYCSISAGVQIYTHHTVAWSTSMGKAEVERRATRIGSGVYIGPNSVIQMGVTVGDKAVIGSMSFVNRDVAPGAKVWGCPAQCRIATPDSK
jgi:acetyltransferase-like isoleucine patch superfamily enzyme